MKLPAGHPGHRGPTDMALTCLADAAYTLMVELGCPLQSHDIRRLLIDRQAFDADLVQYLDLAMRKEIELGGTRFKYANANRTMYVLSAQVISMNQKVEKERRNYKRLRNEVKRMIFLNACYCDEIRSQQEKLKKMENERRFLLHRCMQFEVKARMEARSKTARVETGTNKHPEQGKKLVKVNKLGLVSKGKKKRPGHLHSSRRLAQSVPVDSAGRPVCPVTLDTLTIHSLGHIQSDNENFHTEEHIFPVGFCSTRMYANMDAPERKCLYTCKIVQADDGGPRFEISPEDRPEFVITGFSASECHRRLLSRINNACGTDVLNVSKNRGAEFFGFSHPTIQNLIQNSPGARKLRKYRFVKFETVTGGIEVAKFTDHAVALNYEALQRYPPFKGALGQRRQTGSANANLRTLLTATGSKS